MTVAQAEPAPVVPVAAAADASLRRCIVTRESLPPERLIRFVVAPDGTVVPDLERRLPGRGLWVAARRDIVQTACRRGHFAKAARAAVKADAALDERLERLLAQRVQSLIGLARKAGQAVTGHEKVLAMLRRGPVGVLILAADGSDDARAKMRAAAGDVPVVEALQSSEIGAAFGREFAVHAAVAEGRLASRIVAEAGRLEGFRTGFGKTD